MPQQGASSLPLAPSTLIVPLSGKVQQPLYAESQKLVDAQLALVVHVVRQAGALGSLLQAYGAQSVVTGSTQLPLPSH